MSLEPTSSMPHDAVQEQKATVHNHLLLEDWFPSHQYSSTFSPNTCYGTYREEAHVDSSAGTDTGNQAVGDGASPLKHPSSEKTPQTDQLGNSKEDGKKKRKERGGEEGMTERKKETYQWLSYYGCLLACRREAASRAVLHALRVATDPVNSITIVFLWL